jgi:uncharacterized cupin superfamily protein
MLVHLKELMNSNTMYQKVWESSCKNHRILYFQINPQDKGIDAHFHPFGEDHAFVLAGELTYNVSFERQIKAKENSLVFGWTNYVHGYQNDSDQPLHILVFATPENNLSIYEKNKLSMQNFINIRTLDSSITFDEISSERIIFSTFPPKDLSDTVMIHLESKKLIELPNKMETKGHALYITFHLVEKPCSYLIK